MQTDVRSLIDEIYKGDHDQCLADITQACEARKKARSANLKIGAAVRTRSDIRPMYLAGLTAKVTGRRGTSLVIEFDDKVTARRYANQCTVPPELVEPL